MLQPLSNLSSVNTQGGVTVVLSHQRGTGNTHQALLHLLNYQVAQPVEHSIYSKMYYYIQITLNMDSNHLNSVIYCLIEVSITDIN